MQLTVIGVPEVMAKLGAASRIGGTAVGAALYQEAEVVMTASKQDYVPVDTGALRASGHVDPPVGMGANVAVTLGFGGPSAPYALLVHEDLTKRHKVGQAKYLEIPLRARLAGMANVLALRATMAVEQQLQRGARGASNVAAGRSINWGQPLFGSE